MMSCDAALTGTVNVVCRMFYRQEECQLSVTVRAKLSSPMHDTCHLVKSRTKIPPTMQRGRVGSVHLSKNSRRTRQRAPNATKAIVAIQHFRRIQREHASRSYLDTRRAYIEYALDLLREPSIIQRRQNEQHYNITLASDFCQNIWVADSV